jgi:hypothetical protein
MNSDQKHKICKTNVKTDLYFANICKHKHKNNMTRLWYKIVPKIGVEQTKTNENSYFYLYSFGTYFKEVSKKTYT